MKKILFPLFALSALLFVGTSCDEDRDNNPSLNTEGLELVLNVPSYAANNTYDLESSDYIVLTTSQPDYGYTAAVTYTTYISLDGETFYTIPTTSTTAKIYVPCDEINDILVEAAGDDIDLNAEPVAVYVKISAIITAVGDETYVESNTITLPSVQAYVPDVTLSLPTEMYIIGGFPASNSWGTWVELHAPYSSEGYFYGVIYMNGGDNFKIGTEAAWTDGTYFGYDGATFEDEAGASIVEGDDSGNIKVENSGWYVIVVKATLGTSSISYTVYFREAAVYVIGNTVDTSWSDSYAFTAPSDETGEWSFSDFTGSGELRMYVDCGTSSISWWQSEFTIYAGDGSLYYRVEDIPSSWADDKGSDYSWTVGPGNTVYLDFTNGTGRVE